MRKIRELAKDSNITRKMQWSWKALGFFRKYKSIGEPVFDKNDDKTLHDKLIFLKLFLNSRKIVWKQC